MTPRQKVMRVEHFLTQWGPQTIQLTDGLIKGKDGKMYRSRLMPDKLDVCGPACWESQISEETRFVVSFNRKFHHNNLSIYFAHIFILFHPHIFLRNVRHLLRRRFAYLRQFNEITLEMVSK